MGSTYGTHCLGRARMEPIASRWVGRSSRSRSSAGQDKGTGPTSCTDLAVRQLPVGQDLARGPDYPAPGPAVAHDAWAGSLGPGPVVAWAGAGPSEPPAPHHDP